MDESTQAKERKKEELRRLNLMRAKMAQDTGCARDTVVNITEVRDRRNMPVAERITIKMGVGMERGEVNDGAIVVRGRGEATQMGRSNGPVASQWAKDFGPPTSHVSLATTSSSSTNSHSTKPISSVFGRTETSIHSSHPTPSSQTITQPAESSTGLRLSYPTLFCSFPAPRNPSLSSSSSSSSSSSISTSLPISPFSCTPSDPASALEYDLSNLPIMCASTDSNGEVIFGCADHALYSLDLNSKSKRHVQMYSKRYGHTDWVTSVAHLCDGRVLSAGMEGKLCLWDKSRRTCVDLPAHGGMSISKIISDSCFPSAITCGFDKNIAMWSFSGSASDSRDNGRIGKGAGSSSRSRLSSTSSSSSCSTSSSVSPSAVLTGHADPVVDIAFCNNSLVSGSREGEVFLWDLTTSSSIYKGRGHKGAVTAVLPSTHSYLSPSCFLTSGADGAVKVWDTRMQMGGRDGGREGGEAMKALPHIVRTERVRAPGGGGRGSGKEGQERMGVASVCAMTQIGHYVVTGGSDSSVVACDLRASLQSTSKFASVCKGSIYSIVGSGDTVLASDGMGMLFAFDVTSAGSQGREGGKAAGRMNSRESGWVGVMDDVKEEDRGGGREGGVRWGVGVSERGGARCIVGVDERRIVAGNDCGKALVLTF